MSGGDAWYFAYGANMSTRVLAGHRGVRPSSSEAATLDGFRLVFDLRGLPKVEPGFASVRRSADGCADRVEGVLHRLSHRDLRAVETSESPRYQWIDVEVVGSSAGRVVARTLQNRRPTDGLIPSRRYLSLIVEGAREHRLSDEWIARLQAQPCAHVPYLSPLLDLIPATALRIGRGVRAISRLR
ncbi:MAG: gamma-glutamylcyclotransferase [Polyangiales bacterium]